MRKSLLMFYHNRMSVYICKIESSFVKLITQYLSSTVGQKKKWNIPTYSKTNYRREMKLIPINMDYCLLYFDALIFFLGVLSSLGVST